MFRILSHLHLDAKRFFLLFFLTMEEFKVRVIELFLISKFEDTKEPTINLLGVCVRRECGRGLCFSPRTRIFF